MRKKCYDYLKKPSKSLLNELTTMEQNWVKGQLEDSKPADPQPSNKPKK